VTNIYSTIVICFYKKYLNTTPLFLLLSLLLLGLGFLQCFDTVGWVAGRASSL